MGDCPRGPHYGAAFSQKIIWNLMLKSVHFCIWGSCLPVGVITCTVHQESRPTSMYHYLFRDVIQYTLSPWCVLVAQMTCGFELPWSSIHNLRLNWAWKWAQDRYKWRQLVEAKDTTRWRWRWILPMALSLITWENLAFTIYIIWIKV